MTLKTSSVGRHQSSHGDLVCGWYIGKSVALVDELHRVSGSNFRDARCVTGNENGFKFAGKSDSSSEG